MCIYCLLGQWSEDEEDDEADLPLLGKNIEKRALLIRPCSKYLEKNDEKKNSSR